MSWHSPKQIHLRNTSLSPPSWTTALKRDPGRGWQGDSFTVESPLPGSELTWFRITLNQMLVAKHQLRPHVQLPSRLCSPDTLVSPLRSVRVVSVSVSASAAAREDSARRAAQINQVRRAWLVRNLDIRLLFTVPLLFTVTHFATIVS